MRVSRAVVNLTRCEEKVVRIIGVIVKCVREELIRLLAYLEYLQVRLEFAGVCLAIRTQEISQDKQINEEKEVDQTMPHA